MKGEVWIKKSMDFKDMLPMFIEAGLEFKPDDPDPEGLLVCFEMIDEESRKRIGGGALAKVYGEFLIRSVAVEKEYRGRGLGKKLVEYIIEEAREWDAKSLLLTAKVPGFYKKLGFSVVQRKDAPPISDCTSCPQFHNGCDSEIMRLYL
ncbi:MAG: GNAT family N-acetyltransferase [Dorea sp.]|jgi:amino-acid N-acetyltransferase|nr:GNAT family N-acetyltransferase [Dorea sp.]